MGNTKASKLVDLAWREMVQLAAETLGDDGSLKANSADMSRAAKRYREMRQECVKNAERLQKLEADPPKQRMSVGKKSATATPKVAARPASAKATSSSSQSSQGAKASAATSSQPSSTAEAR